VISSRAARKRCASEHRYFGFAKARGQSTRGPYERIAAKIGTEPVTVRWAVEHLVEQGLLGERHAERAPRQAKSCPIPQRRLSAASAQEICHG
jgi:hypothetical protein